MYSYLIVVLALLSFVDFNEGSKLPDFITPCKGTDPNLGECALKEANKVIPILAKGYPKLNVPVFQPFNIPQVKIETAGQLNIILKDLLVYGLEDSKIQEFRIDLKKQTIGFKLFIPNLNIQCDYEVNGRILVIPIAGNGPANITAVDGIYDINFSFTLYEKKGVQYAKMENIDVGLEIKRAFLHLDNLFNGNKELGDSANAAINQEWKAVLKEIEPALTETIGLVVLQVANGVADKVPYADILGGELPE